MANKDAAFGLRPMGKVGQNRDNQGLSEYQIAASSDAIFQNDPVEMATTGFITVAAATDVLLGTLNGVFFTDASTSKPTFANHLKASNTASDIQGFVADDPFERFEVQSAGTPVRTDIGACADIVYTAGASPNFVSKVEINGTTGSGAAQLKILGVSKDPNNNELGSANANLIVTINEHFIKQTAGI
jgi:hypothetical protein